MLRVACCVLRVACCVCLRVLEASVRVLRLGVRGHVRSHSATSVMILEQCVSFVVTHPDAAGHPLGIRWASENRDVSEGCEESRLADRSGR